MSYLRVALVSFLTLGIVACGGATAESEPDPLELLQVGVEPRAELDATVQVLSRGGLTVSARLDAPGVSAAAFVGAERSAVRIATARGVVVAVDAPSAETDAVRLDGSEARDLDGDGQSDVVLALHDASLDRWCLRVARVGEDGEVIALPLEVGEVAGADACVERFDVAPSGAAEPIAVARFVALARTTTPTLALPLLRDARGWGGVQRARLAVLREDRERALVEVRRALDAERAYVLAVELAALGALAGEDRNAQLGAFDAALRGLVLTESQARSSTAARAHIEAGWRDAVGAPCTEGC